MLSFLHKQEKGLFPQLNFLVPFCTGQGELPDKITTPASLSLNF